MKDQRFDDITDIQANVTSKVPDVQELPDIGSSDNVALHLLKLYPTVSSYLLRQLVFKLFFSNRVRKIKNSDYCNSAVKQITKLWIFVRENLTMVNAWILYKRDCSSHSISPKRQYTLLEFKTDLVYILSTKKSVRKKDVLFQFSLEERRERKPNTILPVQNVRKDEVAKLANFFGQQKTLQKVHLCHTPIQTVVGNFTFKLLCTEVQTL
uniref:Uncharacterized protein n=1 Tax=Vespula pensylvanica TaxID=30213 RepID=A0A834JTC0_VESPE|nr:hypothetical protein H0235_017063 [Vespula pensylvanica]